MSPVFNACKKTHFIDNVLVILKSLSFTSKTSAMSHAHPFQTCKIKKKATPNEIEETKKLIIESFSACIKGVYDERDTCYDFDHNKPFKCDCFLQLHDDIKLKK